MQWPALTIQICTYNRPYEIRQTIDALLKYLTYPDVHWVVSDDCSPEPYLKDLHSDYAHLPNFRTITTETNSGWGANVNNSLRQIETPFIFFLEDDYVLKAPLDLRPAVAAMMVNESIGYMRFDGVLGHRLVCHLRESDISRLMPDYRQGVSPVVGKVGYWLIDQLSPELWLYSNRPHLKRQEFHRFYGEYPEGLKLGHTEEAMAHTVKAGMHQAFPMALAIMPEAVVNVFDHIGHSYQHGELDNGT